MVDIWFESKGTGQALVFLHAAVGDGRMWDPQWDVFSDSYRLVRCDLRGFGRTEFGRESFSHGEDVLRGLDRLGVDSAILVGASLGGHVAMEMALSRPDRIDGLVLISAVVADHEFSQPVREFWSAEDAALAVGDIDTVVHLNLSFWVDGPNRNRANLSESRRAQVAEMLRTAAEHQLSLAGQDSECSLVENLPARLPEIAVPTLVVVGEEDAPDFIHIAHRLADDIADAALQVISNVAHLPSFEAPDTFNRLLADFLATT